MQSRLIAGLAALTLMSAEAMAQRPPSQGQAPPQMSFSKAWEWLTARPAVIVAIVVIVGLVAFMALTRDKSKKT